MINNYTKNKLITPPVKKRYSKENLMMLIFIYHLKQSLSISDIGSLMNFIVDNDKSTNLEELYNDLQIKIDEIEYGGKLSQHFNEAKLKLIGVAIYFALAKKYEIQQNEFKGINRDFIGIRLEFVLHKNWIARTRRDQCWPT